MRTTVLSLWCFMMVPFAAPAQKLSSEPGNPEHRADVEVTGHVVKPLELPAPDVTALQVPSGFRIEKFVENLGNARILAIGPNGNVYVTRREQADVLMFRSAPLGSLQGPRFESPVVRAYTGLPSQRIESTWQLSMKFSPDKYCHRENSGRSK